MKGFFWFIREFVCCVFIILAIIVSAISIAFVAILFFKANPYLISPILIAAAAWGVGDICVHFWTTNGPRPPRKGDP